MNLIGYSNVDILLPSNDTEPELLQSAQCQSSTSVGSSFGVGRNYFERSRQLEMYHGR